MIVLDTNIISEMMKPPSGRSQAVFNWLAAQDGADFFVTSFTVAEIAFGLELLPEGKRKSELQKVADEVFDSAFRARVLAFDHAAAKAFARIAAQRVKAGLHVPGDDMKIAAIALVRRMSVATRNVGDFAASGIDVINPWDYAGS